MPSLEIIQQFQKEITVDRRRFLQALERTRGAKNARITGFYRQLLEDLIGELQAGGVRPEDLEAELRRRIGAAVRNEELEQLIFEAIAEDLSRVSRFLDERFRLLDAPYNLAQARMRARGRIGAYMQEGGKRIGDRLAIEIGALSRIYEREELHEMIRDKLNVTGHRVAAVTDNIIRGYNTELTDNLAAQTGLELWRYEGTIIEHSRTFCRHILRLPYVYTKEQILKMDNGHELDPFTFRGGYRCRHGWAPGRKGWPGYEKPYPKAGRFVTIQAEAGSVLITVPEG